VSTALAIAAVTASLRDLLHKGFTDLRVGNAVGGGVDVTATPPDRISLDATNANNRVNLFLYHVTRNAGWWNEGQPVRDGRGDRVASPPLAVDLRYLVTAYGLRDFHTEILLGHAMQLLHETPVLTRDAITKALSPTPPPPNFPAALATSQLANQIEQIKITHDPINTEEVSRLWSAFNVHYRPSVAYQVSVVLIELPRPRRASLPVLGRTVTAPPFHEPEIDRVEVADEPDAPILPDSELSLQGRRLFAPGLKVLVNGIDLTAAVTSARESEIRMALMFPQAPRWPAGLYAGVASVQVVHGLALGTPPIEHTGTASNAAPFVLRPEITARALPGAVTSQFNGQTVKAGEIEVRFTPRVGINQRVTLLLNDRNPPAARPARAYSFVAPVNNGINPAQATETDRIRIAYRRVVPGDYLARAQVDGAESVLDTDPVTGLYDSPFVTI
jgi:Pvc16 N-terminal domain